MLIVLATLLFLGFIVRLLFGAEYVAIASLLWVYAVAIPCLHWRMW